MCDCGNQASSFLEAEACFAAQLPFFDKQNAPRFDARRPEQITTAFLHRHHTTLGGLDDEEESKLSQVPGVYSPQAEQQRLQMQVEHAVQRAGLRDDDALAMLKHFLPNSEYARMYYQYPQSRRADVKLGTWAHSGNQSAAPRTSMAPLSSHLGAVPPPSWGRNFR